MGDAGGRSGPLARLAGQLPILVLARRNVSRATARSLLAVVAVLIGIVAVGGIGLGGEAFKQNQLAAYEGFGGVATVSPVGDPDDEAVGRTFTDQELDRLRRAAGGAAVTPVVRPRDAVVRTPAGEAVITAQLKGLDDPGRFYELRAGEFPAASDRAVVIGARLAGDEGIAVGDRMTVVLDGTDSRSVRVAGVLRPQGFSDPLNADRSVFLATERFDDPAYAEAIVRIDREEQSLDAVTGRIESAFNGRDRRVFVSQIRQQRERFESFFERVNRFLLAVGAVSLLVAAVTITNTMLMSITEREGELGVLRAVGYPRLAVLRLVLAEAAAVGLLGALGGVPAALGIGAAINYLLLGDPLAFTATGLRYVAVGAVLGVAIALLGGLYPAWTAAGRRPVEALD